MLKKILMMAIPAGVIGGVYYFSKKKDVSVPGTYSETFPEVLVLVTLENGETIFYELLTVDGEVKKRQIQDLENFLLAKAAELGNIQLLTELDSAYSGYESIVTDIDRLKEEVERQTGKTILHYVAEVSIGPVETLGDYPKYFKRRFHYPYYHYETDKIFYPERNGKR